MNTLMQSLSNVKLSSDDKEKLREIEDIPDATDRQDAIRQFIKDQQDKHTKPSQYQASKDLKKVYQLYDTHDFWDSQPVPHSSDMVKDDDFDKAIDKDKTLDDIRAEPLDIPPGFHWANVDMSNDEEVKEVYDLLTQNYVEDDDNMFRFDYSVRFLQWALTPPGYNKDWVFGVRGGKKNKLFGFISGIPVRLNVNGKEMVVPEINFLCVHKTLRTKKLAPTLIKEVTRRVNRT
mmetsp:Transcript_19843/g.30567  ORF Transcript_19843/g.30567 Transcript_19843/m.30567 type:complete len:233 (+) Transcript_19843:198-896(+)